VRRQQEQEQEQQQEANRWSPPPPPSSSSSSSPPHLLRAGADHRRTGGPTELLAKAPRPDAAWLALAFRERLRILIKPDSLEGPGRVSGRGFDLPKELRNL
jgi:hypothetical protein